ncbi:MAG TPA: hypothetical protein VGM27_23835 [Acidobacteriaceae bacterium]|jgi:hypothetical protein
MVTQTRSGKNLLIGFVLFLAAIQCVRSIYQSSVSFFDWHAYALGQAPLPFQGRVGMMPYMRWAENSGRLHELNEKYRDISQVGSKTPEPMTVEKLASLLAAVVSMLILVGAAMWYGIRSNYEPWWFMAALVIMIVTITLAVRVEANYWYVYDLPHAALFGLATICILEGWWLPLLILFAIDAAVRETAIYLVVLTIASIANAHSKKQRVMTGMVAALMAAYWGALQFAVHHRFAHNKNDTGPRLSLNLHTVLLPHHWPQLLSAGGYLGLFVWLERRRLSSKQRVLLWSALLCIPVTLYYGIWVETRIWLEWTLPLALLASAEWSQFVSTNN